jgi:hypothetical protein
MVEKVAMATIFKKMLEPPIWRLRLIPRTITAEAEAAEVVVRHKVLFVHLISLEIVGSR